MGSPEKQNISIRVSTRGDLAKIPWGDFRMAIQGVGEIRETGIFSRPSNLGECRGVNGSCVPVGLIVEPSCLGVGLMEDYLEVSD